MEADLARFYGIDYRDRWRGGLTLRRLGALVRYLPPDAAVVAIGRQGDPHWSIEAHLLDDLRMVWTSTDKKPAKPHPSRPKPQPKKADPRKLAAARGRAAARRRRLTER